MECSSIAVVYRVSPALLAAQASTVGRPMLREMIDDQA